MSGIMNMFIGGAKIPISFTYLVVGGGASGVNDSNGGGT
jgi:hypothetical protein